MESVLLLNATFEPLQTITIQRAVNLLLMGKVEAVEGVARRLRTPSTIFEVPSVLRLRHYVNVPQRGVSWSKRGVLKRDQYTCIYCDAKIGQQHGKYVYIKSDFTVDHIIPRSRGGRNTWSNTACACYQCNQRKGNRTSHEAGMRLRFEPKRPRVNYLVVGGSVPDEWKKYFRIG
jgi:5-methylcytosine-specific restriction endonuclease McrA